MKIIFFGASRFVIPTIEMLNKNYELALVITTEQKQTDTIPEFCFLNKIPFLSVGKFHVDNVQMIKKLKPDIGILGYFGIILPEEILNTFPHGILNIHPSLLPRYRGATPIQSAILNGDKITGTSIIKLDNQMDHGPILAREEVVISESDTSETLYDTLFKKGARMMEAIIPEYTSGKLKLQIQDEKNVTFTRQSFTRQDGFIDIENPPPVEKLNLMIRAFYPWPGVWTKFIINNLETRIKFLPGEKIQVEGKKPMSYKDFLNGYPQLKDQLSKIINTKT